MNVDTDTFAAVTAETEMLRKHVARHAAARERRRRSPKHASRPGAVTQWHEAGYAAAMQEVLDLISETCRQQYALHGEEWSGRYTAVVANAVMELAAGVVELRRPQEMWLSEGDIL